MDPRIVKGIYALATGEVELVDNLADILSIKPEIIETFILLSNFAQKSRDKVESLKALEKSESVAQVMATKLPDITILLKLMKLSV